MSHEACQLVEFLLKHRVGAEEGCLQNGSAVERALVRALHSNDGSSHDTPRANGGDVLVESNVRLEWSDDSNTVIEHFDALASAPPPVEHRWTPAEKAETEGDGAMACQRGQSKKSDYGRPEEGSPLPSDAEYTNGLRRRGMAVWDVHLPVTVGRAREAARDLLGACTRAIFG
jgi:hypothetical protein